MTILSANLFTGKKPLLTFAEPRPTAHDLRRSARSGLARLGVLKDVAERCLNHAVDEIESTYNVHDYFTERAEAMQRWGAHVERFVSGDSGNALSENRSGSAVVVTTSP